MHHHVKKIVPLLVLLLSAAGAVPVWSDDQATEPAVAGESGTTAPESAQAPSPAAPESAGVTYETGAIEKTPESFSLANWLVYKPLWALTGVVGDFNPIGKYVSEPLESKYPGFRFKGYINSITQINATGTNHAVNRGVGTNVTGRDKDWRLQKQEIRTRLEFRYQATDHVEVVSINNFQWDGAYALQSTKGLYKDGSIDQEYYQSGRRIFNEEYVRGNYTKVNWVLGKQIVNWGKMDGKVIDFVNAFDKRDNVDFHIGDYEWRAIGQWMAYVTLRPTETFTVGLLWNPDFQPNRLPANGSPYFSPTQQSQPAGTPLPREIKPSGLHHLADSEAGIRLDKSVGDLSLSAIYYYGFDRDPVTINGTRRYFRFNRFGFASDYATNVLGQRLAIRTEGLYSEGKATRDALNPRGFVNKDYILLAANFETSIGSDENKFDISYSPQWSRPLGYDKRIHGSRNSITHKVGISHSVHAASDKLTLSTNGYFTGGSKDNGLSYNVNAGWRFNDYVTATLTWNDYRGRPQTLYGAFEKWRNVTLDVKYEW